MTDITVLNEVANCLAVIPPTDLGFGLRTKSRQAGVEIWHLRPQDRCGMAGLDGPSAVPSPPLHENSLIFCYKKSNNFLILFLLFEQISSRRTNRFGLKYG